MLLMLCIHSSHAAVLVVDVSSTVVYSSNAIMVAPEMLIKRHLHVENACVSQTIPNNTMLPYARKYTM